jgi:CheY-like chemotaxis protein
VQEPGTPADPTDFPGPSDGGGSADVSAQPADLLSDVEHDLVNSLASITGFSQLIRRDPSLPDDLRHSAGLLVEEAARTRQMVQVLLDTVRQRSTEPPTAARDPVAHAQDAATASTTSTAPPSVLVLDDEPTFRIFLEKALTALGYEPQIAARGPEAVELAVTGDHAILLVDHQMVGMSGIEVYEAVVANRPDLAPRFVMMSGDVLDPALEAFAADHEMTRLAKPFDLDALERTLRTVIGPNAQSRG